MPDNRSVLALVPRTVRFVSIVRDKSQNVTAIVPMTADEYAALALPDAGAPRGIDREAWEAGLVVAMDRGEA